MRVKCLFVAAVLVAMPSLAVAAVVDTDDLTIDIYASFEFEYQLDDEGNGDPNASFDSDQIDIVFNLKKDNFRIGADVVLEHGVATEDGRGNVGLSFGFAEYAASEKFKLRVGKYLTPYGIHNPLNSYKSGFHSVKIPLATNKPDKLSGDGFRFFPRRQVGIAILGTLPAGDRTLDYDVLLTNGDQEETNPFEEDNNSQKALSARVVYEATDELRVGLSSHLDSVDEGGERRSLSSVSAHAQYDARKVRFWTEVTMGELEGPAGAPDVDQLGGFVEFSYLFKDSVAPYIQYQYLETQAAIDQSADLWIAGASFRFKKYAVIKLENAYVSGSRDNEEFEDIASRDYSEIRAAVVLGF